MPTSSARYVAFATRYAAPPRDMPSKTARYSPQAASFPSSGSFGPTFPSRGKAFEESVGCEELEAELTLVDPKKNAGYDVDKQIAGFVKAIS